MAEEQILSFGNYGRTHSPHGKYISQSIKESNCAKNNSKWNTLILMWGRKQVKGIVGDQRHIMRQGNGVLAFASIT